MEGSKRREPENIEDFYDWVLKRAKTNCIENDFDVYNPCATAERLHWAANPTPMEVALPAPCMVDALPNEILTNIFQALKKSMMDDMHEEIASRAGVTLERYQEDTSFFECDAQMLPFKTVCRRWHDVINTSAYPAGYEPTTAMLASQVCQGLVHSSNCFANQFGYW